MDRAADAAVIASRLRWVGLKLRKRVAHEIGARLYRDRQRDLSRSILLTGCARSGTTWLADVIVSQVSCRLLFEPFHSGEVSALKGFPRFPYRRPGDDDPVLFGFAQQVFSGALRHRWVDSHNRCLRPQRRLIKEIRANLFLRWLHDRFPEVPLLLLVRHPCAVVLSRLRAGWEAAGDLQDLRSQQRLVQDFLAGRGDLLAETRSSEQGHAAIWCIQHLVPLSQFRPGSLEIVCYENLCLQPEVEMQRIAARLGFELRSPVLAEMDRPSATSRPDSAILTGRDRVTRWQEELTQDQIDSILGVVRSFGLNGLYDESPAPGRDLAPGGRWCRGA